jgi:hypothetical protein
MNKSEIKNGISNLLHLENGSPLGSYAWLLKNKNHKEYDSNFNRFFGLNRQPKKQKTHISKFILGQKKADSFGALILLMDKDKFLFSFASKIMHMANPSLPIYDSHIASIIKWNFQNKKSKLKQCNTTKDKINELNRLWGEFHEVWKLKTTTNEILFIDLFDKSFPKYTSISCTKKLDFVMWASKKRKFNT